MIKVTPWKTFLLHFILQVSKNYLCRYFPIFFPLSWFIILLLTLLAFEKSIYWLSTSELQPCPSGMDPCALASSTWFPSWLALGSNLSSHPLQGMEFCLEIWSKHNAAIDAPKILIQDCCYRSSTKSHPTLCSPMDCGVPGFPVPHHLLAFAETHVHRVTDAIQSISFSVIPFSSCPQSFWATGLFQRVGSLHQVA